MRRIVLWFLTTVSTVVLLLGYKTSTSSQLPAVTASGTGAPTTTAPRTTSSGATPSTGATTASGSGSALPATANGTFTGTTADTRWGPVQTRVTVASGRITAVDVVQYPDGNGHDREINADALPQLVDETIQAQSANIDMVSGATVTSDGYVESLQSALDQAHAG